MSAILLLVLMVALHTIEDFHVQGIMAQMKQRSWWVNNAPSPKYRYDHLPVILLHGLEWAVFVSLPLMWASDWSLPDWFCALIAAMGLVHSVIDHLKANMLKINLVQGQALHMVQIAIIWIAYIMVV